MYACWERSWHVEVKDNVANQNFIWLCSVFIAALSWVVKKQSGKSFPYKKKTENEKSLF